MQKPLWKFVALIGLIATVAVSIAISAGQSFGQNVKANPDATGVDSAIRVPRDHRTIQAAIDSARDGDLVLVSPGVYAENLSLSGKTIILASEFYLSRDPSVIGRTVIDGRGRTVVRVSGSVGPETKIIGFTIRNGNDGINAEARLHIINNRFVDNKDAIDYEAGGGICRDNFFENNKDDAIDLDGPTATIIERNVIRNNRDDGIEIRLHPYTGPRLDIVIRSNEISKSGEDGIQIIDYPGLSSRFILIERNLINGNAMVGLGLMDKAETKEDYRAASIPERIHVFNNTFVGNRYGLTGGDNLIALNNLFVGSPRLAMKGVDGNSIAAHNLFWDNSKDTRNSNVDRGSTVFKDPLLDSAFRLGPGSPAIDLGTKDFVHRGRRITGVGGTDYLGEAPDLGAFEAPSGEDESARIRKPVRN